jgi:Domain of unknown function (DUF4142)
MVYPKRNRFRTGNGARCHRCYPVSTNADFVPTGGSHEGASNDFSFTCYVTRVGSDVPPETQKFVSNVAVANKFEIDTSNLALKYAKSPDVKNFAQQMVTDHTAAAKDFKAALEQRKFRHRPMPSTFRTKPNMRSCVFLRRKADSTLHT